jgi:hypothetical protein
MKKKLFWIAAFVLPLLLSCNKNVHDNPFDKTGMASLNIPADFNWSSNNFLLIQAQVNGLADGSSLLLLDLEGTLIDKQSVVNGLVTFEVQRENLNDTLRVYAPDLTQLAANPNGNVAFQ